MKALLMLIALAMLTGCVNTSERAYYAQGFMGVRLADSGFASCSRENSGVRLGHEWRVASNWRIAAEYEHISHTFCGRPFNKDDDSSTDHAGLTLTYGGLK